MCPLLKAFPPSLHSSTPSSLKVFRLVSTTVIKGAEVPAVTSTVQSMTREAGVRWQYVHRGRKSLINSWGKGTPGPIASSANLGRETLDQGGMGQ